MKKIESFSNKAVKWVKKLINDSKERKQQNLVVIETKRIFLTIIDLVENKDIEAIFVNDSFFEANKKLLSKFYDRINLCKDAILDKISNLKGSDGIICVLRYKTPKINYDPKAKYLALYDLQNPNNLGAIIRSCLAFNFKGIYLIGKCVDIFHPKTIRSSMGYVFNMPIEKFNSFDYFLAYAKKNNMNLIATANDARAIDVHKFKNTKNNVLLIGNEGNGLPINVLKHCKQTIRIPLANNVESLNASVAAAIVAFYLENENN